MTTRAEIFSRLPVELRGARQWCIAGPDRAPYWFNGVSLAHASNLKPEHWKTFGEVLSDISNYPEAGIGFIITRDDPWACIDLDVKNEATQLAKRQPVDPTKWTSQEDIDRYSRIVSAFDSYTEVSAGGHGLHIWVKGSIGAGARRGHAEVYSQERFIVCTGNVYLDKPVEERQELLELLVTEMRAAGGISRSELEEIDPVDTDMEIYERAAGALNADKFLKLCGGDWQSDYPSQSEADLALMSIFTFYSKSNEQCRRLFRCTALGKREKAVKNDRYLNFTLETIRGRQQREALLDNVQIDLARQLVTEMQGTDYLDVQAGQQAVQESKPPENIQSSIDWPPGLAGAIAGFIYNSAPRPIKEVAIVAALGFLAGVCGKAFGIPQSGLNLYIILIARSGVGKEAMHSGLSFICESLRESIPAAQRFVDFSDQASGPGLLKACVANTSFVNVAGEFGKKLKRFAQDERADGPMASLRTVMTNLYQKSGPSSIVGGITYSSNDKNVASVSGVAYSMIGETTPGTFHESITPSMMEDGFLSRFNLVEYVGMRPPSNKNPQRTMHPGLAQALHGLSAHALTLLGRFTTEQVLYSPEAAQLLGAFDLECDSNINSTNDEPQRQMWNRAHLKVCRVAALLAVGDNWLAPLVLQQHAEWALQLVRRDIAIMSDKLERGEIGTDDSARERKMLALFADYIKGKVNYAAYQIPEAMHKDGVVTKRFIQIRLTQVNQFAHGKLGASHAIDQTLRSLMDSGYVAEVPRDKSAAQYGFSGRCFRIINLPGH